MRIFTKAFTLIELLIVIVIIGILATALIPRIKGMQDKARYMRVEKDFQDLKTVIFMAQSNTQQTLGQMMWHYWWYGGACGAWDLSDNVSLRNLPANHACRNTRRSLLRKIEVNAWMNSWALATIETDPWWNPYYYDLNEGEAGRWYCGARDTMHSAGSDWLTTGTDFANAIGDQWDNQWVNIASAFCNGKAY